MERLANDVVKVFDSQIKHLACRSQELDQETRVSVFLFDNVTDCIIYDKDVLRLPSLVDHYHPGGGTALIDATLQGIADLRMTPEKHGDHAFLLYVLTDGEENASAAAPSQLSKIIANLPDNWTVAALVPDASGVSEAKRFGFPKDNISVWTTTGKGVTEAGENMRKATDNFMVGRAKGIRRSSSLFSFDTSDLNKKTVKASLDALPSGVYDLIPVTKRHDGMAIRDFVEKATKQPYAAGSAYYQLTKKEKVQSRKNICLKEVSTGKVYTGDSVRDLLGLPDFEVRVEPAEHPQFVFFVQSTSYNRKLVKDTEVIVMQ